MMIKLIIIKKIFVFILFKFIDLKMFLLFFVLKLVGLLFVIIIIFVLRLNDFNVIYGIVKLI